MKLIKYINFLLSLLVNKLNNCEGAFGIPSFLEYGSCANNLQPVLNLDLYRFSGVWFTLKSVPNEYASATSCINTNYTWQGDHLTTFEKGLNPEGTKVSALSNIIYEDGTDPKRPTLTVQATGMPNAPLKIFQTDYDTYACLYSCMSFMGFKAEFSWILSRSPTPEESIKNICDPILTENDFDLTKFNNTYQGETCSYWKNVPSIEKYNQMIKTAAIKEAKEKYSNSKKEDSYLKNDISNIFQQIREEEKILMNMENDVHNNEKEVISYLKESRNEEKSKRKILEHRMHNLLHEESSSSRITSQSTIFLTLSTIVLALIL